MHINYKIGLASTSKKNFLYKSIDEEQQEELHDYFINSETDEIEKALEEFDGEYEEFELKLFRIKFLSDFGN